MEERAKKIIEACLQEKSNKRNWKANFTVEGRIEVKHDGIWMLWNLSSIKAIANKLLVVHISTRSWID